MDSKTKKHTSKYPFCETQSKRSVEVYRGKNLDPPPACPTYVSDIFNWF